MDAPGNRRLAAAAVALVLLLLGGVAVVGGLGGDDAGARTTRDRETRAGQPDAELPPDGADPEGSAAKSTRSDRPGRDAADPGGGALDQSDPTAGPVGDLVAASLDTTTLDAPEAGVSVVAPQFSPDGRHLLATSGRQGTLAVWVLAVDAPTAGWSRIPSDAPFTEPRWGAPEEVIGVVGGRLVSWTIGATAAVPLIPEADEPGRVQTPVAAPGGRKIAYIATTLGNNGDVRVLDRDTGVIRSVTASPDREADPAWRADGGAVVATVSSRVTAWALDQSSPIRSHQRELPAKGPGWWGDAVQWQEGRSLAVDLVYAAPPEPPIVIARKVLATLERPVPVVAGYAWLSALSDPGTVWAVRPDGSGIAIDTDAEFATQPDVVQRADGLWIAFTSRVDGGTETRIHTARVPPELLSQP